MQGESILNTVHPEMQRRTRAAIAATEAAGVPVIVRSGLRDYQTQVRLYANRASNPLPVAPPGVSPHEWGIAVDMRPVNQTSNGWAILWRNAQVQNLRLGRDFSRTDPPHFELPGFIHGQTIQPGLFIYGIFGKPGSGATGPIETVENTVTDEPIANYNNSAAAWGNAPVSYQGLAIAGGLGLVFLFLILSD